MSRGVVLWPDAEAAAAVRDLWDALAERGLPSHATHTHRLHVPHCSLKVAEDLPVDETLQALGALPRRSIPLMAESVGVFPPNGTLFLGCVVNSRLLDEQRRVHEAVAPLADRPWPFFEPDGWVPHITLAMSMSAAELAEAVPLAIERLPIRDSSTTAASRTVRRERVGLQHRNSEPTDLPIAQASVVPYRAAVIAWDIALEVSMERPARFAPCVD